MPPLDRVAHISVDINVGSEPISGEVVAEAESSRPFSGWAALAAEIEAARMHDQQPANRAETRAGGEHDH